MSSHDPFASPQPEDPDARIPPDRHPAGEEQELAFALPADEPVLPSVLPADEEDIPTVFPADEAPARRVRPAAPHPGFWTALLWCVVFLGFTQIPGSFVAVVELMVRLTGNVKKYVPEQQTDPMQTTKALLESDIMSESLLHAFAITEVCVVLCAWGIIRLIVGWDWKRQLGLRRPSLPHLILVIVGLPGLVLMGNGFYELFRWLGVPGMEDVLNWLFRQGGYDVKMEGMEEFMKTIAAWPLPIAILIIGVGAGVGEELFCRGFLGRGLVGNYGLVLGIVFTSFFFGLIHVDPRQGLMAACMGVLLHYVYWTTRSLWIPILWHFLNNTTNVLGMHMDFLRPLDSQPQQVPLLYAAAVLLLGSVLFALYQSRARLCSATDLGPGPWQPGFLSVEHPPPGSGTIVVYPRPRPLALALVGAAFVAFAVVFQLTSMGRL